MAPGVRSDAVLVLAPGVVLERRQSAEGPDSARLRADDRIAELGPDLGELAARLTGAPLSEVVDAVLGVGPGEEREQLVTRITTVAAQLVEAGFLVDESSTEPAAVVAPASG